MAVYNCQFWVTGIRKKEFIASQPVDKRNFRKPGLLTNQNLCFGNNKK